MTATLFELGRLRSKGGGGIDPKRTGSFTTAVVAEMGAHTAVLFFTGWKHAGENLSEVLRQRASGWEPPIQMCDALSRNFQGEFRTLLANCLSHGRREFGAVPESFPEECRQVLESLGKVYGFDAEAKERGLEAAERLAHHQPHSGPVMEQLHPWLGETLVQKCTEPNFGLGQAIR